MIVRLEQRFDALAQRQIAGACFVKEGSSFGRRRFFQRSGKDRFFGHFEAQLGSLRSVALHLPMRKSDPNRST